MRRILCLLTALMLWSVILLPVSAASGEIRVDMDGEGTVALYLIGTWEDGGYRLLDSYGGGALSFDDTLSSDLAAWLASRAEGGISRETEQGIAVFSGLNEGLYLVVQTGEREGYHLFEPFLVSLPWDGTMWELEIAPEMEALAVDTPQTGDVSGLRLSAVIMMISMLGLLVIGSRKKC